MWVMQIIGSRGGGGAEGFFVRLTNALPDSGGQLPAAGVADNMERPLLDGSGARRRRASAILDESGLEDGKLAESLPGSHAAGFTKRWGVGNHRQLALLLDAVGLTKVVLLGGPDEADECAANAEGESGHVVNPCGRTQLLKLPAVFEREALIVANDTGTAHLATASNQRMIVICGPTDPRRLKPVGNGVIAIRADLSCENCYRKTCDHQSCQPLKATCPRFPTDRAVRAIIMKFGCPFPAQRAVEWPVGMRRAAGPWTHE